ncbi:DUF1761 domain-containing protein [Novosphingobium profundi]|uniref:DUF1761 domain-containing protein n=1 Tax=Novosphingobium profundi TaxID=1774954 RepID=UPI001BDB1504|nr:DUF1761 domain-containing protein [Novosphingobium profundi]MBT0666777.1 DUF1761 domain-containing protein [Novosphingobium profundi]
MGPVNWLAVGLAAGLGFLLGLLWYGPLSRNRRQPILGAPRSSMTFLAPLVVMGLAATMFGHAFARIGVDTLAAKPWLYFMQTGGIAIAFVMPVLWLTHLESRTEPMWRVFDCLFWLVTYLAMGAVFWLLG